MSNEVIKSNRLTKETLKKHLPKGTSHQVTDEVMNMIYQMEDVTGMEQKDLEFELLSNMNIAKELKVDLDDYVNALKYVVCQRTMSNRKAWELVFPDRLAKAEAKLAENEAKKARGEKYVEVNIDSMVSNYNKNKVVVKLTSQLMIAAHIQYAPMFHAAIKKQFDLMNGKAAPNANGEPMTVTPHVQHMAAKELALLTQAPEEAKIEVDINVNQGSIIDEYEKAIGMMAEAKMKAIEEGHDMLEMINAPVRVKEVRDEDVIDVGPSEFEASLESQGN